MYKLFALFIGFTTAVTVYAQCPTNAADFANGGTFGACTEDYGGSITITGDVIINGNWELQDMDGAGLIIANGGSLTIQSGTFTINDNAGFFRTQSELVVQAGGTLTIENGATFSSESNIQIDGTATVESGGTIEITQSGEFNVGGQFDISGTLTTANGLTGDLEANGGTINIYSGADVDLASDLRSLNGGTVYVQTGANVDVAADFENQDFFGNASQGTFIIDGDVAVGGDLTIVDTAPDSGLSGGGMIDMTAGGTFNDNEDTSTGSFSGCGGTMCAGTDSPLPVELIYFTYEEQFSNIRLEWSTATELNNEGFYVERSYDGVNFESIGFVAGNGTTNEIKTYSFTDVDKSLNRYYRLLQVDFDGAFEYHNIIFVEINSPKEISIYPNPVAEYVRLSGNPDENYQVALMDFNGRVIYQGANSLRTIESDLNRLVPSLVSGGQYLLKLGTTQSEMVHRVLKR